MQICDYCEKLRECNYKISTRKLNIDIDFWFIQPMRGGVFYDHYAWNMKSCVLTVRLDTFIWVRYGTHGTVKGRRETVLSLARYNPTKPERERAKTPDECRAL